MFPELLVCARLFVLDKDEGIFRMKVWLRWDLGSTSSHEGHWEQEPDLQTSTSSASGLPLWYASAMVRNHSVWWTCGSLSRGWPFSPLPDLHLLPSPQSLTFTPQKTTRLTLGVRKQMPYLKTDLIGIFDTCKPNSTFWDSSASTPMRGQLTDQAHNKNTW